MCVYEYSIVIFIWKCIIWNSVLNNQCIRVSVCMRYKIFRCDTRMKIIKVCHWQVNGYHWIFITVSWHQCRYYYCIRIFEKVIVFICQLITITYNRFVTIIIHLLALAFYIWKKTHTFQYLLGKIYLWNIWLNILLLYLYVKELLLLFVEIKQWLYKDIFQCFSKVKARIIYHLVLPTWDDWDLREIRSIWQYGGSSGPSWAQINRHLKLNRSERRQLDTDL